MPAATLTKDQWWFILTVSVVQALVALVGVGLGAYLGARWALSREDQGRRRARGDAAAVAMLGTVEQLTSALVMLEALHIATPAVPKPFLDELLGSTLDQYGFAFTAVRGQAAYLHDPELRKAIIGIDYVGTLVRLMQEGRREPVDWQQLADWATTGRSFLTGLGTALESYLRGEPYEVPTVPSNLAGFRDRLEAANARRWLGCSRIGAAVAAAFGVTAAPPGAVVVRGRREVHGSTRTVKGIVSIDDALVGAGAEQH
jgi:hypothetical protein